MQGHAASNMIPVIASNRVRQETADKTEIHFLVIPLFQMKQLKFNVNVMIKMKILFITPLTLIKFG